MKICKKWWVALLLGALLGLGGCNAVSFFPYKAAEKAADKVLDDILPGNGSHDDAAKPPQPQRP